MILEGSSSLSGDCLQISSLGYSSQNVVEIENVINHDLVHKMVNVFESRQN
jgi:hypothetical protein